MYYRVCHCHKRSTHQIDTSFRAYIVSLCVAKYSARDNQSKIGIRKHYGLLESMGFFFVTLDYHLAESLWS